MPLSKFTQTLPLDFAAAASESEAAPVGAALVELFLAGAGELAAGALEEEPIEELPAAVVVEAPLDGAAVPESLVAVVLLFRLFFGVAVPVSAFALAD